MSVIKEKYVIAVFLLAFAGLALASSSVEKLDLDEFPGCETAVIGKTYKYISGTSTSGEVFQLEVKYIGEEKESESFLEPESLQVFININNKFKYDIGKYSGCRVDNSINNVWVENVPQGYKVFWRVGHTGQAVPEDYQGVILSNEGKFIEKYYHEI